jgi:ribonuclease E
MAKKLLIDANHPEEIRVAVVNHGQLEEFDSETSTKKQIKGNIYLAKVIRVEPSLQAAFVDFGGNRHGFLPFSEIHPDYYRIPVADREAVARAVQSVALESSLEEEGASFSMESDSEDKEDTNLSETADSVDEDSSPEEDEDEIPLQSSYKKSSGYRYKIQEVIKRRQIMLIQVVKEERGNKGAALTTYLSLPGRYCVLMPNAGYRAGGVSRKINDGEDRKRLRDVVKGLDVPEGMALIVRTAGQERNKTEIKRDYEYLLGLWTDIRELTLKSIAPFLVYAEGDLVKRAIRDIYSRDIDEILIEGDEAYKAAKNFMRALIPSHARKVQPYKDENVPLFHKFRVEEQIAQIMYPSVKLSSGGSIVVNATEALVAIDVNSGRATRERHIDETALKTNLEAADEIARQMRLRDLAGLVVIDFIDMNDQNHIQQVEKRLREATKHDRARIQLGKISQFGLMELSRQRLRPSLIETHTTTCTHCHGTGLVRSTESMALHILRAIETFAIQGKAKILLVTVPNGIDLYLLNQKRSSLSSTEIRYGIEVEITRDSSLNSPEFRIEILAEKDVNENGKTVTNNLVEAVPIVKPEVISEPSELALDEPNQERRGRQRRTRFRRGSKGPMSSQQSDTITVQENEQHKEESPIVGSLIEENIPKEEGQQNDPARHRRRERRRQFRRRGPRFQKTDGEIKEEPKPNVVPLEKKEPVTKSVKKEEKTPAKEPKSSESEQGASKKKQPKGWLRRLLE